MCLELVHKWYFHVHENNFSSCFNYSNVDAAFIGLILEFPRILPGWIVLLGQSLPGLWSLKRKGERHFTWKFNCPFPLLLLLFRTDEQRYIAGKVAFFFKSLKETAAFLPSRHFRSVIDFCVNYFGTERLARLHGKLPSTHIISIHTRIVRISK